MGTEMESIIDKFSNLTEKPVKYLSVQEDIKDDIKTLIKSLYDYTKSQEGDGKVKKKLALPEIIVNEFDEEQIWQQIELQNTECWDQLTWDVANSISNKNDLIFSVKIPEVNPVIEQEFDASDESENECEMSDDVELPKISKKKIKPKAKSSIVDDEFFNLKDMEKFLINEEKLEGKNKKKDNVNDDEESIDLFEDNGDEESEDEGEKDMMYSDFFNEGDDEHDPSMSLQNDENESEDDDCDEEMEIDHQSNEGSSNKLKKKVRFAEPETNNSEDDSSDDSAVESTPKKPNNDGRMEKPSEFELRQQRLKQQISKLEEKTLIEAPWQLKGEVDAKKRPENSLLQEVLDFDLTSRPAPIITEQTTITLEGLIKQRVKDKAWDDVLRKEKPVDDQLDFKKAVVLDQSKSKLSLAQVYEAEYLKQKQALNGEVNEDEPESHKEIRDAMSKLFSKLDALCHYHYTPKPPQAEVKIVSNTPAISMEEVAPVATSEATLLAPEEIKKKQRGDLMSKEERTKTDKNRERRKKKKLQRKKGGVTKVTDQRNTKKGVEATDKSLKTSKAFFQQLNDESTSLIRSKNKKPVKNKGE